MLTRYTRTGGRGRRSRGYSLVELAITLPTVAILTLGMSAAVLVSVRSIPQPGSLITANTEATRVLERLERDLRCAVEILRQEDREIRFRVPDRNGDGQPETIRYWWSGVSGTPVFRQVNAHAAEILLGQTANFELEYQTEDVSRQQVQREVVTSQEVLLSSDEAWGVLSTLQTMNINRNSWAAPVFTLASQIPLDCSRLRFTRAVVTCRRNSVGTISVGLYRVADGLIPRLPIPVGSRVSFNTNQLPPNTWQSRSIPLSSDAWVDDGCRRFALLISSTAANTPLQLRLKSSIFAPRNDRSTLRWTSNQGTSWQPDSSNWHQRDLFFEIYGHYERTIVSQVTETTENVRSIRVILNSATNQGVRIDASIGLLNQPEDD